MNLTVYMLPAPVNPTPTVSWCGETWNMPADSGVTKEVLPSFYKKTGGTHAWQLEGTVTNSELTSAFIYWDLVMNRIVPTASFGGYNQVFLADSLFNSECWWSNAADLTPTCSRGFMNNAPPSVTGVARPTIGNYFITPSTATAVGTLNGVAGVTLPNGPWGGSYASTNCLYVWTFGNNW